MNPPSSSDSVHPASRGWVLYDGRCGFCSAGARRTRAFLHNLGFAVLPLQTPWVVVRLGKSMTLTPRQMALLTRDGALLEGVDAYIHIAGQFWWGRPFARLARLSLLNRLLRKAYQWIADRRQRISAVCRLTPDLPAKENVP